MGSPFREAAAAHAAAVAEVRGERLRLLPQVAAGDFTSGGPDTSRSIRDFIGTVVRRSRVIERRGEGSDTGMNLRVAAGSWRVGFDAALGLDTRAGDLVERLDSPGEPLLRLAAPEPISGRVIHPADEAPK